MAAQRTRKSATRDSMRPNELMDWVRCRRYGGTAMASRRQQPGVEAGAREGGEEEEEQQGEEEEVGDMREADLGEGERGVHADVRAATQQVAVVGDEDERGEAERLAELLQHSSILLARHFLGLDFLEEEEDAAVVEGLTVEQAEAAGAGVEESRLRRESRRGRRGRGGGPGTWGRRRGPTR